jgi:hypothetical protein
MNKTPFGSIGYFPQKDAYRYLWLTIGTSLPIDTNYLFILENKVQHFQIQFSKISIVEE